jgi:hypothetical protein
MTRDVVNATNGIIELYALNNVHNIPIVVHDENNFVLYIIDNGLIFNKFTDKKDVLKKKEFQKYLESPETINLRFTIIGSSPIPLSVDVIYYK